MTTKTVYLNYKRRQALKKATSGYAPREKGLLIAFTKINCSPPYNQK